MRTRDAGDLPLTFVNTGDGTYDVLYRGARLGGVRRDGRAWSYGRWFVDGKPAELSTGGYTLGPARGDRHRAPRKPHGFETREGAALYLAMMQSGVVLANLPPGGA